MAAIGRSSTPTAKQVLAAERIASFTAEQRRLKAAATRRRAAVSTGEQTGESSRATAESAPVVARRSQYLQ
jgi:hypothetical protein